MSQFKTIGLMGKPNNPEVKTTLHALIQCLSDLDIAIWIEKTCAPLVKGLKVKTASEDKLGKVCHLLIVVGGDGSLLKAARTIVNQKIPVIGINRGRKGFLTDISPQAIAEELIPMLQGDFLKEERFLAKATISRHNKTIFEGIGLNDVVLYSGHVARMMEFDVSINHEFVARHRSDGLIVATPTGSTAYALSGGGPILHPSLDAMVLVPMHPHTLSSRPIAVNADSKILLKVSGESTFKARFSYDGQIHTDIEPGDEILIERHSENLQLLHPKSYDYYQTLRSKLGWHIYQ